MKAPDIKMRRHLNSIKYPVYVDTKYDGELNMLIYEHGNIFSVNKYGRRRDSLNGFQRIIGNLKNRNTQQCILLSELVATEGKQGDLYNLLTQKNSLKSKLAIFDIMYLDGNDVTKLPLDERREILMHRQLQTASGSNALVNSEEAVIGEFKNHISDGYEGVVVKERRSQLMFNPSNWVKLKYQDTSNFEVAEIDSVRDRIEVHVGIRTVGVRCTCKSELSVGDIVEIKHYGFLEKGGLRHPSFVRRINDGEE